MFSIDANTIITILVIYFFISIILGILASFRFRKRDRKTAMERIRRNIFAGASSIQTSAKHILFAAKPHLRNRKKLYLHSVLWDNDYLFFVFSFSRFSARHILFCIPEILATDLHRQEIVLDAVGIVRKGFFYLPLTTAEKTEKLYQKYMQMLALYTSIEEQADLHDIGSIALLRATEPVQKDRGYFQELLQRKEEEEREKEGGKENAA